MFASERYTNKGTKLSGLGAQASFQKAKTKNQNAYAYANGIQQRTMTMTITISKKRPQATNPIANHKERRSHSGRSAANLKSPHPSSVHPHIRHLQDGPGL
jgi:hypothetical protein